jgi:hypothetical protein
MKSLNIKFYTLYLLLAFLFTTGMQCKKTGDTVKEDVLPAETQTGKGTFGCLVDGEVWLPTGKSFIPALSTTIQFDILTIATNKSNENLVMGVRNISNIGDYDLKATDNIAEFSIGTVSYKCFEGKLTITKYDKINQIISGKFWFKAKNSNGENIEITEGRFDDKYTN